MLLHGYCIRKFWYKIIGARTYILRHMIEYMKYVYYTLGGVKSACKDPSFAQSLVIFAN